MKTICNIIATSDWHCGCKCGLIRPGKLPLPDGGFYLPSKGQKKMYAQWEIFWREWVPMVTNGEPFVSVINGDTIDNEHHGSKTPITTNITTQRFIAEQCMDVIRQNKNLAGIYVIIGTSVHDGESGDDVEEWARNIGAVKNPDTGRYANYELWIECGKGLAHFLHHIGTTSSSAHEASAVNAELTAEFTEAARWRERPPDVIVRSHRHRHIEVRVPTKRGYGIACVTAGWQLKTPFTFRIAGGRLAPAQLGGTLIRWGHEDGLYTRHRIWHIERSSAVRPVVHNVEGE